MTITRYKLSGNTTAHVTGSKTFSFSNVASWNATPVPPTGLSSHAIVGNPGRFEDAGDFNPAANSGSSFDAYFYKEAGVGFTIGSFACSAWNYTGHVLSCAASGGIGLHILGTNIPAYSGLAANPKTSDGLLGDNQWHRLRLLFPSTSANALLYIYSGASLHETGEPSGVLTNLWNFTDWQTYGYVYWSYVCPQVSGSYTRVSDVAYGLYADTPPARSATDWAVTTGKSYAGIMPI